MAVTPSDLIEYQRGTLKRSNPLQDIPHIVDLTGTGEPERLQGLRVSAQIFSVLGVSPVIGRSFTPAEDRPDSGVAVISYPLWQERFGGDPGIAGRVVDFNRQPTTIVGVLPKGFEFPLPGLPFGGGQDVWVPLGLQNRIWRWLAITTSSWLPDSSLE